MADPVARRRLVGPAPRKQRKERSRWWRARKSVEAQVAADLAVEARGVVKRFGADVLSLDGLDLRIEAGRDLRAARPERR